MKTGSKTKRMVEQLYMKFKASKYLLFKSSNIKACLKIPYVTKRTNGSGETQCVIEKPTEEHPLILKGLCNKPTK
jgi:hypothetical protein